MPVGVGLIVWVLFMTMACSGAEILPMAWMDCEWYDAHLRTFGYCLSYQSRDMCAYLRIFYVPSSQEVAVFCAAIAVHLGFMVQRGTCKSVYGGYRKSGIGGCIGCDSDLYGSSSSCRWSVYFLLEGASVVLQVASYRLRGGKRIFLCAPIHHPFSIKGGRKHVLS